MDALQFIILTFIGWCAGMISFFAGCVWATPEDNPNETIEYLKHRVDILETREHMRMLDDRDIILSMTNQANKHKNADEPEKKKGQQTKWG